MKGKMEPSPSLMLKGGKAGEDGDRGRDDGAEGDRGRDDAGGGDRGREGGDRGRYDGDRGRDDGDRVRDDGDTGRDDGDTGIYDTIEDILKRVVTPLGIDGKESSVTTGSLSCTRDQSTSKSDADITSTPKPLDHLNIIMDQQIPTSSIDNSGGGGDVSKNTSTANPELYCDTCQIKMWIRRDYTSHMNGNRHKLKLERIEKGEDIIKNVYPDYSKYNWVHKLDGDYVRGESQLEKAVEYEDSSTAVAPVGLMYVTEYQVDEGKVDDLFYFCSLCGWEIPGIKQVLAHVKGVKHGLAVIGSMIISVLKS